MTKGFVTFTEWHRLFQNTKHELEVLFTDVTYFFGIIKTTTA